MKKIDKKYVIFVIILLFIAFILYQVLKPEKYFNPVELPTGNYVMNRTPTNYHDTIVHWGLHFLGIEGVYVRLDRMANRHRDQEYEYVAHIISSGNQFLIYVNKMSRQQALRVLSHELIHLEQYYWEDLVIVNKDTVIYDGELYVVSDTPYDQRPWETDARQRERLLEKKIREVLWYKQ